jgi:hypothetical protein
MFAALFDPASREVRDAPDAAELAEEVSLTMIGLCKRFDVDTATSPPSWLSIWSPAGGLQSRAFSRHPSGDPRGAGAKGQPARRTAAAAERRQTDLDRSRRLQAALKQSSRARQRSPRIV